MELELGLKITQTKGDLTSTTSFQMAKDSSGPIFMSTQTDSKFILTAHLKGFGKEHIGIKINEDGTQIAIKMEKPVQEMVMSGLMFHKKEVEMKGFIRVFRIPSCVDLDRIKAKFNGRDSVLTIVMPKSRKGILELGVVEEVGETSRASLQDKFDRKSISEASKQGMTLREAKEIDKSQQLEMLKEVPKFSEIESSECGNTKEELQKVEDELFQGFKAMKDETQQLSDVKTNIEEEEEEEAKKDSQKQEMLKESSKESDNTVSSQQVSTDKKQNEEETLKKKKRFQLCKPCVIAGSSIIVTLVVFAIHWIRSSKRKQLH